MEKEIFNLEVRLKQAKDHDAWSTITETSEKLRVKQREYRELRRDKQ